MGVTLDPPTTALPASGGSSKHVLSNDNAKRLVFKVKCSNNGHLRAKPVFGFCEPAHKVEIEVTRLEGPPRDDRFVIEFADAPEGSETKEPQSAFMQIGETQSKLVLPIKTE
ncbi:unnamed protein product, partial [Mesorhabditis spiculigera]